MPTPARIVRQLSVMTDFSSEKRRLELEAIRESDPGKIVEEFRRARLAVGNFHPSPYDSLSRMIETIVAIEQQQARQESQASQA